MTSNDTNLQLFELGIPFAAILSSLLIGKAFRDVFRRFRIIAYVPSAFIGGTFAVGLSFIWTKVSFFKDHDMNVQSAVPSPVMLALFFALLYLGLDFRSFFSLWHIALPSFVYLQILSWGMYSICFTVVFIMRCFIVVSDQLTAALVVSFDGDLMTFVEQKWDKDIIQDSLAASYYGELVAIVLGLLIIGYFNWTGGIKYTARSTGPSSKFRLSRLVGDGLLINTPAIVGKQMSWNPQTPFSTSNDGLSIEVDESESEEELSTKRLEVRSPYIPKIKKLNDESLLTQNIGLHIGAAGSVVFVSSLIKVIFVYIEDKYNLNNIDVLPLFVYCMIIAVLFKKVLKYFDLFKKFSRISFHQLSVFILEVKFMQAMVSLADFNGIVNNTVVFLVLLATVVVYNLLFALVFVQYLTPNYWRCRGVVSFAQAMGSTTTALLLLHTIDRRSNTSVPISFTYSLIFHLLIMGGGVWTSSVPLLIDYAGIGAALGISLTMMFIYLVFWLFYLLPRYPHRPSSGFLEMIRNINILERSRTSTESSIAEPLLDGNVSLSRCVSYHQDSTKLSDEEKLYVAALEACSCNMLHLSTIIERRHMAMIWSRLPPLQKHRDWYLRFSIKTDGVSLRTLFGALEICRSPCVVLVEDSWGYIFGAYVNEPFSLDYEGKCYGNGECFLFRFEPTFRTYQTTGKNQFFMVTGMDGISLGAGGGGFGLHLDRDLMHGVSNCSETYENDCLASKSEFTCVSFEIWSLERQIV